MSTTSPCDYDIDMNWISSPSAEPYVTSLYQSKQQRLFGLLEQPALPPQKTVSFVKYKLFICGKSNVGKTSSLRTLVGGKVSKPSNETTGIETSVVHWPVRLSSSGQILFFSLNFWDVGDQVCKKFDHILPACLEDVDCVLYTFSVTDRSSFKELPSYRNRFSLKDSERAPLSVIIATKTDQYIHSDIQDIEISNLSEQLDATVLKLSNVSKNFLTHSDKHQFARKDTCDFLNTLCDLLWKRDQYLSGLLQQSPSSPRLQRDTTEDI